MRTRERQGPDSYQPSESKNPGLAGISRQARVLGHESALYLTVQNAKGHGGQL